MGNLEDAFFKDEDKRLIEEMRTRKDLTESTGIADPVLVQRLVDLGLGVQTLAALSLVPMVRVAFADGEVDEKEREAVMKAAAGAGIVPGTPASTMLAAWLKRGADQTLVAAWQEFAKTLVNRLHGGDREALSASIVGRAREIAEASGGFLGLGNKVSKDEQALLDDMGRVLRG